MSQQQERTGQLPPLPAQTANDDERARAYEARWVAQCGAPSIADFRRIYASFGAEWPGDDEVRRRHLVADPAA